MRKPAGDSLRIAFCAKGFPPGLGGAERYNFEYANALHQRGHELRVWVVGQPATMGGGEEATRAFDVSRRPAPCRDEPRWLQQVSTEVVQWKADVVFVAPASKTLKKLVTGLARQMPVVLAVHDLRERQRRRFWLNRLRVCRRYGFDRAAAIVPSSTYTRDTIMHVGVPPERVHVVHPGVDTQRFVPNPSEGQMLRRKHGWGGASILLTVSRLVATKGHRRVMDLLPCLRQRFPDVLYVIVGAGAMEGKLKEHARAKGVGDRVVFAGWVPDLRPFYNACDVFVMPSHPPEGSTRAGEGFGISYAEAGACAKPVVASASGGAADVVEDGETGLLVAPEDADGLLAAVSQLLEDTEMAKAMGRRAQEHVRRFDWNEGTRVLEGVLRRVVQQ